MTIRIPVRRFSSGVTHLADLPDSHPYTVRHFVKDFASPDGPITTLCATTLQGALVHMKEMGTHNTSPRGCPVCISLAKRDQLEVLSAPEAELLKAAVLTLGVRDDGCYLFHEPRWLMRPRNERR